MTLGETSLSCPPSYLFLGLGPNDPRDFVLVGESGNLRPPENAVLHKIWPLRVKFYQTANGRRLKTLVETQCCIFHGFASENWSFRLCEALMSSKPETLFATKENPNFSFNQLFFTHTLYFPNDFQISEKRKNFFDRL